MNREEQINNKRIKVLGNIILFFIALLFIATRLLTNEKVTLTGGDDTRYINLAMGFNSCDSPYRNNISCEKAYYCINKTTPTRIEYGELDTEKVLDEYIKERCK